MIQSIVEILCVALGVAMLVLAAMKNIWTFVVGMVQVALMSFVNYLNYEYVQAMFHVVFLLPMQFVGYWLWIDRGARLVGHSQLSRVRVIANGVGLRLSLYVLALFLILTPCLYGISLLLLNSGAIEKIMLPFVLAETLLIVLNIIGQILMSLGFVEQWYVWIIVNILSLALSAHTLATEEVNNYSLSRISMDVLYFIISLIGLYIWRKTPKNRMKLK